MKAVRCYFAVLFLSFCLCCQGQKGKHTGSFNELARFVQSEIKEGNGPGAAIAVSMEGETYTKGFGVKNTATNESVDITSFFLIASTAKVFTAYAILKLQEQGKLELHDKISLHIEDIHPTLANITIHQLISHTGGLEDIVEHEGPAGISRHLHYAGKLDGAMKFTEPGLVFSYSNPGYNILGGLIEKITGKNFNSAMRDLVFNDFRMLATTYRIDELNSDQVAMGHLRSGQDTLHPMDKIQDNAEERASGFAFTNVAEINPFLQWFLDDQPHHPEIRRNMLTATANYEMTGSDWQYGYGLFHSRHCNFRAIWHSGGVPGYRANFLMIPDKKFSIAIYTNGPKLNRWEIINKATEIFLATTCDNTSENNEGLSDFSEEEQHQLVGDYSQRIGAKIKIFTDPQGKLILQRDTQQFQAKKDKKGRIVALENGKEVGTYSIAKDDDDQVRFLQNWVRAYPKLN